MVGSPSPASRSWRGSSSGGSSCAGGGRAATPSGDRRWRSRRGASDPGDSLRGGMIVRELELDLDAFEGPFDLLLTLVLREELEPADVDMAAIVVAFVERLPRGRGGRPRGRA